MVTLASLRRLNLSPQLDLPKGESFAARQPSNRGREEGYEEEQDFEGAQCHGRNDDRGCAACLVAGEAFPSPVGDGAEQGRGLEEWIGFAILLFATADKLVKTIDGVAKPGPVAHSCPVAIG
jgi:hypothetical protein